MSTVDATSDRAVDAALDRFVQRARAHYPVIAAYLYGSRARRDHAVDSDVDVAVILDEAADAERSALRRELSDIAFDLLLETGIYIQHIAVPRAYWDAPERFSNPGLIRNIRRDGRLIPT
jgi:antitoxin ChpS